MCCKEGMCDSQAGKSKGWPWTALCGEACLLSVNIFSAPAEAGS